MTASEFKHVDGLLTEQHLEIRALRAEIDRVFAEAPAIIREIHELLRGVVTP